MAQNKGLTVWWQRRLVMERCSRSVVLRKGPMMSRRSRISNIYIAVAAIVKSAGGSNIAAVRCRDNDSCLFIAAARSADADSLCVVGP
ncbi:hypothetical protein K457DRAFT_143197 [Linnemannia elongata AG-77]|uniref:Uncharacterized protein n=1 Tax=Linnemannia elongata AG-77 TaxID=1314771 RepID=A0A197JCP1_9FUNG|nr:hypothetical protein K457DRAFT_143197 [Linnemannia elongata AG-77]